MDNSRVSYNFILLEITLQPVPVGVKLLLVFAAQSFLVSGDVGIQDCFLIHYKTPVCCLLLGRGLTNTTRSLCREQRVFCTLVRRGRIYCKVTLNAIRNWRKAPVNRFIAGSKTDNTCAHHIRTLPNVSHDSCLTIRIWSYEESHRFTYDTGFLIYFYTYNLRFSQQWLCTVIYSGL